MSSTLGSMRAASPPLDTAESTWRRSTLDAVPEAPDPATPASKAAGEVKSEPLALRRDIAEAHKRTMASLKSLREVTKTEADARHAASETRLAEIDTSLNRIEGALRIEVGPLLRDIMNDCLDSRQPAERHPVVKTMKAVALLLIGTAIGTLYGEELLAQVASLMEGVRLAGLG